MAKDATVGTFSIILTGLLTQYDIAESKREIKRGGRSNIYRLGHLLKAAQDAEAEVSSMRNRSDAEAIKAYRAALSRHFVFETPRRGVDPEFTLSPLRKLDKMMSAWLTVGKLPHYPMSKLRANQSMAPTHMHMMRPAWKAVFG